LAAAAAQPRALSLSVPRRYSSRCWRRLSTR